MDKVNFRLQTSWFIPLILSLIIIFTNLTQNFLLFHTLAELFAIYVAISIGIISINTFSLTENRLILFLGMGYIWIGVLDLLHTLTMPNMGMFEIQGINTTATIWVLSRLFEASILLSAIFLKETKYNLFQLTLFFFFVTASIVYTAFYTPMHLFVEGLGLTALKNNLEYLVVAILLLAFFSNRYHRRKFNPKIYLGIQFAIILTIFAELSFTTYVVWDGLPAVLGHLLKFISFWILYESIINISLKQPIEILEKDASSYNSIPLPSIVVSFDGVIKQVNQATLDMLNCKREEVIGKQNHEFFHLSSAGKNECEICKAIKNTSELNNYVIHDIEKEKYLQFSVRKIGNLGMIQVCSDVTEARELEIEKNKQLHLNEKIYTDLFELNKSIIILLEPKTGDIINANNSAIEFYGYTKAELLSFNIFKLNQLSQEEVDNRINTILDSHNKNHYFNFVHTLKNNEKRNVRVYSTLSIYNNNEVLFSTINDITEEITAKNKLENIQKDYKNLFNTVDVSIWNEDFTTVYESLQKLKNENIDNFQDYLDENPKFVIEMAKSIKVINVNQTTLKMFKFSVNQPVNIASTFAKDSISVFKQELLAIFNQDDTFRHESDFITLNGDYLNGIISFSIPKNSEEASSVAVSILDITELQEKDKLLHQQSKMAAMGEMIDNIAHQWRQPLSIIATAATGIKIKKELETLSPEKIDQAMDHIGNTVQHLSQTIDDFRDFFKTGKKQEKYSLESAFERLFVLLASQFKTNNIHIIKEIEDVAVFGLENELIQVLINMLTNARDELLNDIHENKFIFITARTNNKQVEIVIRDNAGGIKNDSIDKIFNSHFTTKSHSKGTGVGLYMSKLIIEDHMKGQISAENIEFNHENESYCGAQFTLKVPINQ
mgnify:CR=1 FL=1